MEKGKRFLSFFMSLVMLISAASGLGITAQAAVYAGGCGDNAYWSFDTSSGTLTISGSGDIADYNMSSSIPWYSHKEYINKLVINSGITGIGHWAFYGLTSLTSVTISNGVTTVGGGAFEGCVALPSVKLPDSTEKICASAFSDCVSLTEITVPKNVSEIESRAFSDCASLSRINVSSSNQYYTSSDGVLFNNDMTKLIQYPAAKAAQSYTLPATVTQIEARAFDCCASLEAVSLPAGVIMISNKAFSSCKKLREITVPESNKKFSSEDGVLLDKNKTVLLQYPVGNERVSYAVPESVTTIDYYAFEGAVNLTSVIFEARIETIRMYAFDGCYALKEVYYSGTDEDWERVDKEDFNDALLNADVYTDFCNHKYVVTATAEPTCTEKGYSVFTCAKCGDETQGDYTNALGHATVKDAAVPATCTQSGLTEGSHCARCKAVLKPQESVAPTGHAYTEKIEKDPNCCWEGTMRYTCVYCGSSYTTVIPATGQHTFSELEREPATCSKPGKMDHICEFCQYAYATVIPATGKHEYGADGKCVYCGTANPLAVVTVGGVTYTLNSNNEYVSSKAKKPSISKLTKGKKQFKVTWKKVSGVTGYQVQYATDSKFKKNKKTVTVKGAKNTSKTVKSLKSKKTYYVRMRTYKTVNGKKLYSSWSKARFVKIK